MELVKCVLDQGGLVDRADNDNMTCMHYAVLRCNQILIIVLRRAGFDINKRVRRKLKSIGGATSVSSDLNSAAQTQTDQYGLTPLHAAAFFGRKNILPYIIDQGADVNANDEYGQTPIHLVVGRRLQGPQIQDVWNDDIHMAEYIPDWDDEYSAGILSDALDMRTSIVSTFCENLVFDPNIRNRNGQTPLHMIRYSKEGKTKMMVKLLVDRGASRTATDAKGKTPIHVASRAGDLESLTILVKDQEDLNLRDKQGRNALHLAAQSGIEDAVLFILKMASSLGLHQTTDVNGRNALHHSLHSGSKWFIHPRLEVLNILLQEGVSARHTNQFGMDPLAYYITKSFWNCQSEVVSLLLAHGANLHFQDELGRNLAHHLMGSQTQIAQKALKALKELENWGVDVQARDQEGKTILHHAAIKGSVSTALLHHLRYCHQLDFDTRDNSGMTAMEYADEESQHSHFPFMFRPDRWKETVAAFNEFNNIGPGNSLPSEWTGKGGGGTAGAGGEDSGADAGGGSS